MKLNRLLPPSEHLLRKASDLFRQDRCDKDVQWLEFLHRHHLLTFVELVNERERLRAMYDRFDCEGK